MNSGKKNSRVLNLKIFVTAASRLCHNEDEKTSAQIFLSANVAITEIPFSRFQQISNLSVAAAL